ncbi:MAG: hypothetical protein ABFC77_14455 [Thermoguttaceae bacterium]
MRLFLTVLAFSVVCSTAFAQQAETKDNGARPDYRELVKGLVSPNKPIKCYGEDQTSFPPGYDRAAQSPIEKNRRILYEHCAEALPFLMEGCTDTRYSLTWKSDSYADNSCVGEVCLEIIASHLEVYRKHMSLRSKERYYTYRFVPRINGAIGEQVTEEKKKEIEDWWRGRKGKNLLELQVEAFDWAIAKRKKEFGNREESDAAKEIKHLVAARNKLEHDRKCLPPLYIPPSIAGTENVGRKTGHH